MVSVVLNVIDCWKRLIVTSEIVAEISHPHRYPQQTGRRDIVVSPNAEMKKGQKQGMANSQVSPN